MPILSRPRRDGKYMYMYSLPDKWNVRPDNWNVWFMIPSSSLAYKRYLYSMIMASSARESTLVRPRQICRTP